MNLDSNPIFNPETFKPLNEVIEIWTRNPKSLPGPERVTHFTQSHIMFTHDQKKEEESCKDEQNTSFISNEYFKVLPAVCYILISCILLEY